MVEIVLKALARVSGIEAPRVHDISPVLETNRNLLPKVIGPHIDEMILISRSLRRDRELAFYGTEDLTPSEFYKAEDGQLAFRQALWVYERVSEALSLK